MKMLMYLLPFIFFFAFPANANAYTFPSCFPWCYTKITPTPTPTKAPVPTPTNTPMPTPTPTPSGSGTPSASIFFGASAGPIEYDLTQVTNFEADTGKKLAIVLWYQAWGNTDGTQYLQPSYMTQVRNHGSIPMITWEPWNYTLGVNQSTYRLANIYNGRFDSYITKWAIDSKNWGHPFFLRFAHEMNGNWYPWGESVNGNQPGDYVKAWNHIHNIFVQQGATNVSFVWCPNVIEGMPTAIQNVYPGDNNVDWICMDGYNWGNSQSWSSWQTFNQVFQNTYNQITSLSQKPLMIGEMASTENGGSKANWITNTLGTGMDSMPRIKAFNWFNFNKEQDWRIESSQTSQTAFQQAITDPKYYSNSFANLNTKP